MTTDLINHKTISQTINDGEWHIEKAKLPLNTWEALQLTSKTQNLTLDAVLTYSTLLALKTWRDLTDQSSEEQLTIISNNKFSSIPYNLITENSEFEHRFLEGCKTIHSNIQKGTESVNNTFLVSLNNDIDTIEAPEDTPNVIINLNIKEEGEIVWYVNPEFLSDSRVKSMIKTQALILNWFAEKNWDKPIPDVLSTKERTVRTETNNTLKDITPQPIHQAFFQYAEKKPDVIALYFEDNQSNQICYGELADKALKLAGVFKDVNTEQDSPVAIILPKGASQIIAVMGVLGSGNIYIPIGVEQPIGRQEKILKKAGIKHIVTDTSTLLNFSHLKDLANNQHIDIINLDDISDITPLEAPIYTKVDQLAYVIFTSGSTGEPKGVEITHRAAWNTIQDINTKFSVTASDCALAVSALDFDLSVYDIFGVLAVGGSLVLIHEEERKEASRWLHLVDKYKVTLWNSVPALFDMLLISASEEHDLSSLRLVLVSGDWVGLDLKDRLKEKADSCQLIALGGATEASIWSNFFPVDTIDQNWTSIPYGKPLANQKYRVVNQLGMDCPDGVIGELWIGGIGVASGYTNNEALTHSRFVTVNGEKWYRTGDLGRYWPDGNLEFLGRMDHQVKVNGFRIELGEIEAALKTYPGVEQSTAVVQPTNQSLHLVAGVVGEKVISSAKVNDGFFKITTPSSAKTEYELQKQVVAKFLYELLELSNYNITYSIHNSVSNASSEQIKQLRQHLIKDLSIAPEQVPVLNMWIHWLQEEAILIEKKEQLIFNIKDQVVDSSNTFLSTFKEKLYERKPLLQQILSNVIPSVSLLDDDLLSPEILSTKDTGVLKGIAHIADKINEVVAQSDKKLKVAILGGRTGLLTEKLLQALHNDKIAFSVIDEGRAMLLSFTERLSEAGYQINGIELKNNQVPEEYWYHFDIVVSIYTLHRFPEPDNGVFISNLLLNNSGRLLAIESDLLMPLAMVSSGVIDRGFQNFDRQRKEKFNPMLDKDHWKTYFSKIGFEKIIAEGIKDSSSILYDVLCSKKRHQLTGSQIVSHIQNLLPPHMIPEKIAVLPSIPLSANGKVDRKQFSERIKTMLEADIQKNKGDFENPVGEMEESIAEIWKQLLALEAIDRNDVFFEIGGDSLSATRFLTEVKKQFGVDLSLRELFGATLKDIATKLDIAYEKVQQELETMEIGEI